MIDPLIEAHLWFLLTQNHFETVSIEDVCWFNSGRALRVIEAAGLVLMPSGRFAVGRLTEAWAMHVFKEVRHDHTAQLDLAVPAWPDYEPTLAASATEALPAPPADAAARAAGKVARHDFTPLGTPALTG